ncbi:HD domain-containing protein [Arenimonas oryziterrae]|nr:hypothetical protein [Arenimonas oryziterrae]
MNTIPHAPMPLPPGLVSLLLAAYATPIRAYHNFDHVHEVLGHYAESAQRSAWRQPREVFLAVLFHDAIYQAGRRDNEERSAVLALEAIAEHLPEAGIDGARVAELIRLTARHGRVGPDDVDEDARRFLDGDMAILGAAPAAFDAYHRGIASEYRGKLPGWLFEFNRRRFLKGLLAKERIFLSDAFHGRFDAPARVNLQRVLQAPRSVTRAGAGR